MSKLSILFFLLWIFTFELRAQTTYQKAIDDTTASGDYYSFGSIFKAAGNNFVIGTTDSCKLIKINSSGTVQWARQYPVAGYQPWYKSVWEQTEDGYFMSLQAFDSVQQVVIARVDSEGNLLQKWSLAPLVYSEPHIGAMVYHGKQLFVCGASFGGEIFTFVIDSLGSINRYRHFSINVENLYSDISKAFIFDSSLYITLYTLSGTQGEYSTFLLKADLGGNLIWVKQLKIINNDFNRIQDFTFSDDHLITVVCEATEQIGIYYKRLVLAQFDTEGNMLWHQAYKYNGTAHLYSSSIKAVGNDFVVAGHIEPFQEAEALTLIKFDSTGNLLWANKYDYSGSQTTSYQTVDDFVQLGDSGFMIAGRLTKYLHGTIIKTNTFGESCTSAALDVQFVATDVGLVDKGFSLDSIFTLTNQDVNVVDLNPVSSDNCPAPSGVMDIASPAVTIFPNPFDYTFEIHCPAGCTGIKIRDIQCNLLQSEAVSTTEFHGGEGLSPGVFIVEIELKNGTSKYCKVVKAK